jgi:hypothetical protein
MFAAGIDDGVKSCDRATDAVHAKIEEDADGGRPQPHHLIHGHVEVDLRLIDGHGGRVGGNAPIFFVLAQSRENLKAEFLVAAQRSSCGCTLGSSHRNTFNEGGCHDDTTIRADGRHGSCRDGPCDAN